MYILYMCVYTCIDCMMLTQLMSKSLPERTLCSLPGCNPSCQIDLGMWTLLFSNIDGSLYFFIHMHMCVYILICMSVCMCIHNIQIDVVYDHAYVYSCVYILCIYVHTEVHANIGTYMHSYRCRRRFATSAMPKKGATMHSACQ